MTTLIEATNSFLSNISKSRSALTHRAYRQALLGNRNGFLPKIHKSIKYEDPIGKLNERHAMQYMQDILDLSPATRQLHAAAIRNFYTYVAGQDWATVSIERLNFLLKGAKVLTPVDKHIVYDQAQVQAFLQWVYAWEPDGNTPTRRLRSMRDKAFVITLAESGLRVHEACKVKIKDINFEKAAGVIVGKGNKQARFKIGEKASDCIKAYLAEREKVHAVTPEQPVFARHDRRAGKHRALPMSTQTGEAIIHELETRATGKSGLTCHILRHRFVTRVLERTQNLKLAQELARHTNINVTERYAHLMNEQIDVAFDAAFNQ